MVKPSKLFFYFSRGLPKSSVVWKSCWSSSRPKTSRWRGGRRLRQPSETERPFRSGFVLKASGRWRKLNRCKDPAVPMLKSIKQVKLIISHSKSLTNQRSSFILPVDNKSIWSCAALGPKTSIVTVLDEYPVLKCIIFKVSFILAQRLPRLDKNVNDSNSPKDP